MLKYSSVEPHLQGSQVRHLCEKRAVCPITVKDWKTQAEELTLQASLKKYRSLAIYAEIKLAESLDKCNQLSSEKGVERDEKEPDALKTAACCKILNELCGHFGPLSTVLNRVQNELIKAIYSNYYAPEDGTMHLSQTPYFAVCKRLEAEKERILAEKEACQQALAQEQGTVRNLQQQVGTYVEDNAAAKVANAELQKQMKSAELLREQYELECQAAKDELKRARKDLLKIKDEWTTLRGLYDAVKGKPDKLQAQFDEELRGKDEQIAQLQHDLASAKQALSSLVPKEELTAAQAALQDVERRSAAALADSDRMHKALRTLTPRPDWRRLAPEEPPGREGTKARVEALAARQQELQVDLGEARRQLALCQALLEPDAEPREVELTVGRSEGQAGLFAQALGIDPGVPRYLRAAGPVPITPLDQAATEALIAQVWAAKERHDAVIAPNATSLQAFLYIHARNAQPGAEPWEVAPRGYSLLHAARALGRGSPSVYEFTQVLAGQLPERAHGDFGALLRVLAGLVTALGSSRGGTISRDHFELLLRKLLPHKEPAAFHALEAAMAQLFAGQPPMGVDSLAESIRSYPAPANPLSAPPPFLALLHRQFLDDTEGHILRASMRCMEAVQALAARQATSAEEGSLSNSEEGGRVELGSLRSAFAACVPEYSAAEVDACISEALHLGSPGAVAAGIEAGMRVSGEEFLEGARRQGVVRLRNYFDWQGALVLCRKLREPDSGLSSIAMALPEVA